MDPPRIPLGIHVGPWFAPCPYDGVAFSEEHARQLFAPHGQTSEAVEQQAVVVTTEGPLPHRMEGPVETGCAGAAGGRDQKVADVQACMHEQRVGADGVLKEEQDAEEADADLNAGLPDEEYP